MRIVTLNLPAVYIDAIGILVAKGLYPSRSETVRVALRKFLKNELEMVEVLLSLNKKEKEIKAKLPLPKKKKVIDMRSIRAGWPDKK